MFLYMWFIYRKFPSLLDWNIEEPNKYQEATRLFLCYYLLIQGGRLLSPRWVSEPWGPDPIIPSQVFNRRHQSRTIVSHNITTKAINAQAPRNLNVDTVDLATEPRTKAALPSLTQSSHTVFDVS